MREARGTTLAFLIVIWVLILASACGGENGAVEEMSGDQQASTIEGVNIEATVMAQVPATPLPPLAPIPSQQSIERQSPATSSSAEQPTSQQAPLIVSQAIMPRTPADVTSLALTHAQAEATAAALVYLSIPTATATTPPPTPTPTAPPELVRSTGQSVFLPTPTVTPTPAPHLLPTVVAQAPQPTRTPIVYPTDTPTPARKAKRELRRMVIRQLRQQVYRLWFNKHREQR